MAAGTKMLRGTITVVAAYPEYAVDPLAPTVAELNDLFAYTSNEDGMVFPISCAITDDGFTANKTESETDDTRTLCDVGQVQNKTFDTYEVMLDALRDAILADPSTMNMFLELFMGVDRPFYIITRLGPLNTEAFAVGQYVKIFGVTTDYPTDLVEDNTLLGFGARFKNTGDVVVNYQIAA